MVVPGPIEAGLPTLADLWLYPSRQLREGLQTFWYDSMTAAQHAALSSCGASVDRLVHEAPAHLHGHELEKSLLDVLAGELSLRPTQGELFLCSLAALALSRLIEHERREKGFA